MKAVSTGPRVQVRNVFATDFAPAAAAAVPGGKEIATRCGAGRFALHVRPPVGNPLTPVGLENELLLAIDGCEFSVAAVRSVESCPWPEGGNPMRSGLQVDSGVPLLHDTTSFWTKPQSGAPT